jgi:hypothetical protein
MSVDFPTDCLMSDAAADCAKTYGKANEPDTRDARLGHVKAHFTSTHAPNTNLYAPPGPPPAALDGSISSLRSFANLAFKMPIWWDVALFFCVRANCKSEHFLSLEL